MTIDSHQHFWNYEAEKHAWITDDMQVIRHDFLPADFELVASQNNVQGSVAVQADQSEKETNFLVSLAENHPIIKGVVGWVDLQAENVAERLQYFKQFPIIKGWRHVVQSEPDDFLLRPNFQRGISQLAQFDYTYDVLIYHSQLKAAIAFADAFPNLPLVVDHCAKPDIKNHSLAIWKSNITALAKRENVCCKISGLITEAHWTQWTPADLLPYLDVVFEVFGTNRILFGSDWPVMQLAGNYGNWKQLLETYMHSFSDAEKQNVFGNNAIQFYNLQV